MAFYQEWDAVFNSLTAGVVALLGLWVLTLRPRTKSTVLLGTFAVAHGLHFAMENSWDTGRHEWLSNFRVTLEIVGYVVATSALLALSRLWITKKRVWLRFAAAVAVGSVLGGILAWQHVIPTVRDDIFYHQLVWVLRALLQVVFAVTFAALPLAFAIQYRYREGGEGPGRRQLIMLATALIAWPAIWGMRNTAYDVDALTLSAHVVIALVVFATGIMWILNIGRDARLARTARRLAVFCFALLALATIDALVLEKWLDYSRSGGPFFGLARVATVVILVHAITRHDVLGVDVRLRWGISKSTVAAMFVAVFFIASEGASQFFGDRFNSQYLGIAAAGAMVFAIAPLSRMADALAEKALPQVKQVGTVSQSEERYQALVVRLVSDGSLSVDDEQMLAHLADDLGIAGGRAFELKLAALQETGQKMRVLRA